MKKLLLYLLVCGVSVVNAQIRNSDVHEVTEMNRFAVGVVTYRFW